MSKQPRSPEITALTTPSREQLVPQYLITVQQFADGDYAEQVARGEIEVFYVFQPPKPRATKWNREAWQRLLAKHGNGAAIHSVKQLAENYYMLCDDKPGGIGVEGSQLLVVFPVVRKNNERTSTQLGIVTKLNG